MGERDRFPIQIEYRLRERSTMCAAIYLRAYEVYSHCFGPQAALIEGECRGGFGIGEVVAFLYAYPFPKDEWKARVDEACRGMTL